MNEHEEFVFAGYGFDAATGVASFKYNFDDERWFEETVRFEPTTGYDQAVLNRALFMAYIMAGISYYKCFPTNSVRLRRGSFSTVDAAFFSEAYRDGLSQFVYENGLSPDALASFQGDHLKQPLPYAGTGVAVLQSGGKDSLLLAELLKQSSQTFTVEYMRQSATYPVVIDAIGMPVRTFERTIDHKALKRAAAEGGLNGHVPITYIVLAYTVVDAVLHNQNIILSAIGREGEEAYEYIGDYAIRHQWAKTWRAEQMFAQYIHSVVSADMSVGSPLRGFTELKIAELFASHAWPRYKHQFSSCNVANYKQGHSNEQLRWCGKCPKCANSYLLFAPFIRPDELMSVLGKDLFTEPNLIETFQGLLGIGNIAKPFECVGETAELRVAYAMALANGHASLPFDVPPSDFDRNTIGPAQDWAVRMIQ